MPFHEKQLEVDGFEIRYWKSGQGRPVVMLDPTGWRETVLHDALAEQYQVFSLELPGTGYSPANTCLLYTSPSPRDGLLSRMPSSA